MTYRRIVKLALASAVATGLAWAWTGISPASAEPSNSVLVSLDGQQWSQSLVGLFPEDGFFPGVAYTRTVQVKNDSAVDATLEVAARDASGSTPEFLDMLLVGVRFVSGAATELPLSAAGACTGLLRTEVIPAGAAVPVELTLRMADVSGDAGMGETAMFDVTFSLRQVGKPSLAAECGIAGTSSPDPAGVATAGVATAGAAGTGGAAPGTKSALRVGPSSTGGTADTVPPGTPVATPGTTPDNPSQLDALGLRDAPGGPTAILIAAGALAALGALLIGLVRRRSREKSE